MRLDDIAAPVLLSIGVQLSQRQRGAASTLWHPVSAKSPIRLLCVSEGSPVGFCRNSSTSSEAVERSSHYLRVQCLHAGAR
jgi:hypothetical protein